MAQVYTPLGSQIRCVYVCVSAWECVSSPDARDLQCTGLLWNTIYPTSCDDPLGRRTDRVYTMCMACSRIYHYSYVYIRTCGSQQMGIRNLWLKMHPPVTKHDLNHFQKLSSWGHTHITTSSPKRICSAYNKHTDTILSSCAKITQKGGCYGFHASLAIAQELHHQVSRYITTVHNWWRQRAGANCTSSNTLMFSLVQETTALAQRINRKKKQQRIMQRILQEFISLWMLYVSGQWSTHNSNVISNP